MKSRATAPPFMALIAAALYCVCSPAIAQSKSPLVYVGIADQWNELIDHPAEWTYVRQNADGFYLNFIMMEPTRHSNAQALLKATAALFTHKNAYFESDYKLDGQNEADDDRDIDMLQKAGFRVPFTSLNSGWDAARYENLKTYHLLPNQKPRYSFVQDGPWTINGDIKGNVSTGGLFPNAEYRRQIDQADGDSTDGPLGFWFYDPGIGFNKMQSGSCSMVNYAHAEGKAAVVMLCPYGAGISTYDAKTMFVATGEDCVRRHEDADAEPQVWDVFEYATTIGAVPEQSNGAPAQNSTTAMAYYLIKHIKGDPATLHLSTGAGTGRRLPIALKPAGQAAHYTLNIVNTSSWLDYAAVLKAAQAGSSKAWAVRYTLKGRDITRQVLGQGFKFYRDNRVNPKTTTPVDLYVTRTSSRANSHFRLTTQLLPHQGQPPIDSLRLDAPDGAR